MPGLGDLIYSACKEGAGWQQLSDFAQRKDSASELVIEKYGFGRILRQMCGFPSWLPLRVMTQHGVSLWNIPNKQEMASPERFLLVHSRRWLEIYRSHGFDRAVAIGSPFVMYRRNLADPEVAKARPERGAIFFLSHSTFWEKAEWQKDRLLAVLDQIRTQHGSVTVCLHFVDVINGLGQAIFDAGHDIATAGNYFNSRFPDNFYRLLFGHEVVYTNSVGSHVFYAVEAQKQVRWVDLPANYVNIGYNEEVWKDRLRDRPIECEVEECLRAGSSKSARLAEICSDELGLHTLATPDQLRKLVVSANFHWYTIMALKRQYWRAAKLIQ